MKVRRLWPAVALVLLAAPVLAGNRVEDAARMLQDGSYKVRLQAALVLGRLGDQSAVDALSHALADPNKMVRAVAAQSLGRLGSRDALPSLESLLKRERDEYVRGQAEKAIAALGPAPETARRSTQENRGKIYLTLGSFTGGARGANGQPIELLRTALRRELGKLSNVSFTLEAGEERNFAKSGRLGFLIDGSVTRLDESSAGSTMETNCDVKVMVARWPSRSIIMWTSAGAAVQGGTRSQDRQSAWHDCLEASASQLAEDLSRFFQSQGR